MATDKVRNKETSSSATRNVENQSSPAENPNYSTESYASAYAPEKSIYQDDSRIFHRYGCEYDTVVSVVNASLSNQTVTAHVLLKSGAPATLSFAPAADRSLRIRLWKGAPRFSDESPMLVSFPASRFAIALSETPTHYCLVYGSHQILLSKDSFGLSVRDAQGRSVFEIETDLIAGDFPSAPLGFRIGAAGAEPYLSWKIRNDERFYGFGEKFSKLEKSSTRATVWSVDTCGSNTTDMSYKSLPVLFSTRGWGVLLHTSFRSKWEVGTFSYTSGSLLTQDPTIDLFLFLAPSLKELIDAYTTIVGKPYMPPKWALGVWMSRCAYMSRAESTEVVDRLRAEEIPCDAINIDPQWMAVHYYYKIGVDACDFVRNDLKFPDLPGMFREYREKEISTCLWINPYLLEGTPIYDEAKRNGYMVKSTDGGVAKLTYGNPVGFIDFTNPAARSWWKGYLTQLVKDGCSVFKPDYGDATTEDALYHNGKTGTEMHNLYLHLYCETAFEAVKELTGQSVVWRRAGYVGSQRFVGTWAGDTQVSWQALKCCVRSGLSAGLTGEAFWTSDIGGFAGPKPSDELYCRWVEFGMLSGLTRFHGTTPREPWYFGAPAMDVVKRYSRLRYSLMPYLLASAHEACAQGLPMMRAMVLEFQGEAEMDVLEDQYMLGRDVLVAPILSEGARDRTLYLPQGRWISLENPALVLEGGRFVTVDAP